MSPHKTGIEETGASFKKGKVETLRDQILYTYHRSQEINEKTAFLLLRIADTLEPPKPAKTAKPGESSETEKETE